MNIPSPLNQDESRLYVVIKQTSISARIHQTIYTLESRVIQFEAGAARSEYRILLESGVIKDWTEGDISQYFGLDIY